MSLVVRIQGGLGNQMFQYATATSIAKKWRKHVTLDLRSYARDHLRSCRLLKWNVSASVASRQILARRPEWLAGISRRLQIPPWRQFFYVEQSLAFDPCLGSTRAPFYLEGYFQSPSYFEDVRDILMAEFTPRDVLEPRNMALQERIARSESAAVHVRRTDYVDVKENLAKHGVCNLDYYQAAVKRLSGQVDAWFVFSDDIEWCRANMVFPGRVEFVTGNTATPEMDIHLMKLCKHVICANSSFSWWGAWLNANPGRVVIAPQRWFASTQFQAPDLLPSDWIRM